MSIRVAAAQHDDVLRVAAHRRDLHVRDVLQRVGDARVLRDAPVVVVHLASKPLRLDPSYTVMIIYIYVPCME